MAQERLPRQLRLSDFLDALRKRGREAKAEEYRRRFIGLYCPPFAESDVLEMPFDALCTATTMINTMNRDYGVEARVSELKSMPHTIVTYGEHYLKKHGGQLK